MNWNRIESNWQQLKGQAKRQWSRLTDDQFEFIAGKRDQLLDRIQVAYGVARDEAERQVNDWERRCERIVEKQARRDKKRMDQVRH